MFAFLVILAMEALLYVASALLTPRPHAPRASTGTQPPTANAGDPIAVVFGTQRVAPNVVWYGNVRTKAVKQSVRTSIFTSSKETVAYRYGFDFIAVVCWGLVDEVLDFVFNDKAAQQNSALRGPPLSPNTFPVAQSLGSPTTVEVTHQSLFGPATQAGGVMFMTTDIFFGHPNQAPSARAATLLGAAQPSYPGLCYLVSQGGYFGNSPTPAQFSVVVRRCPSTVSTAAGHPEWANIGGDANGAEVIYDILTSASAVPGWEPLHTVLPSSLDLGSFQAAAETLYTEGLGVSFTLAQEESAEHTIQDVLTVIDGVLYPHPETALWTLKLARQDYVLADQLLVDETNSRDLSFGYTSWPEVYSEVNVRFVDRGLDSTAPVTEGNAWTFAQNVAQKQNLATRQAMGGRIRKQTLDMPMLSNKTAASIVAARVLRTVSVPIGKGSWKMNRTGHALTVGQVVRRSAARFGLDQMPMRITNLSYGKLEAGQMSVSAVQDVFAVRGAMDSGTTTSWTNPATGAALPAAVFATEVPYGLNDAATPTALRILTAAIRANGAQTDYVVYSRPDGTTGDPPATRANQPFTPGGTLRDAYGWGTHASDETEGFVVENAQDMDDVVSTDNAGWLAGKILAVLVSHATDDGLVEQEIVSVQTVTRQDDGSYKCTNILRGQFDTPIRTHAAGSSVFFVGGGHHGLTQDDSYVAPESVDIWVGPSSAGEDYDFGSPFPTPMAVVVASGRAAKPYPPANLRINTRIWPTMPVTTATGVTLTWSVRNRAEQGAACIDWTADVDATPEGSYEVKVYVDTTVVRTDAVASGTTYVYSQPMHTADCAAAGLSVSDPVKFEIRAVNNGVYSAPVYVPGGTPGDPDSAGITITG